MSLEQQIKILCVKLNTTTSGLARISNTSPQNFSQKLKRGSFTIDELKELAKAAGCEYHGTFTLPNGETVQY